MAAFNFENGVTTITATSVAGEVIELLRHHDYEATRRLRQNLPPFTARIFKLRDVFGAADGANVSVDVSRYSRGYAYCESVRITETVDDLRKTFTDAGFADNFPKPRATFGGVWRSWGHGLKEFIGYSA